ncbi:MAG: response regulator, partial [Planctomycetaceae bacterium]|nr:response regulator [Planctomycetaceae bacterium]
MSGIIAQRKSILIVEDEPIIRETLAEFLMGEGFEVRTTGTVSEALAIARERDYDVAVCDIQ